MAEHVHDCTGPDSTCPCGYKFTVPRFGFDASVFDNNFRGDDQYLKLPEPFMTDRLDLVIYYFQRVVDCLREYERSGKVSQNITRSA